VLVAALVWSASAGTCALAQELKIPMLDTALKSPRAETRTGYAGESARALVQGLCAHARRRHSAAQPGPAVGAHAMTFGWHSRPLVPRSKPAGERAYFGNINMRFGHFALLTRELDGYGRLRGIEFLRLYRPGSPWNIEIGVSHGASLRLRRRWEATSESAHPFAAANKRGWFGN
jgi:hypothetical protein